MNAALLTLLALTGVGQSIAAPGATPMTVPAGGDCAACEDWGYGRKSWLGDWFGPMPQTCYSPRFGCYPGNGRDIQRYPAYHGYASRAPYNYRHYFDYPWHAAMHEPQPNAINVVEGGNPAADVPSPPLAPYGPARRQAVIQ